MMEITSVIQVSHQQYTIASNGVVSMPTGSMDKLVEKAEGFLTVHTGTFWGPVKLTISTDPHHLKTIDDSKWETIEQGIFRSTATLHVETNDGAIWGQFVNLADLPASGLINFRAFARGRVHSWGRDTVEATEDHLVVLWPTSDAEPLDAAGVIKSDGKGTPNPGQHPATNDQFDSSDARVRTIGPFIFGSRRDI